MLLEVLKPFLSWSYWLASYPGPLTGVFFWAVVGLSLVSFIAGLAARLGLVFVKDQSYRRLLRKLSANWVTLGVLMGLSFFFTQTATPVLGSRWWFGLWLGVSVVWLGFILRYAFKVAPQERSTRAAELANLRYLPRAK
ncbi:MAG: hypothetical protein HY974_02130 [Candidatus Kerfeldbacteria bacterium]|nr:hypothetical protein [Candidatus Kerfeldbacteria bacterium]